MTWCKQRRKWTCGIPYGWGLRNWPQNRWRGLQLILKALTLMRWKQLLQSMPCNPSTLYQCRSFKSNLLFINSFHWHVTRSWIILINIVPWRFQLSINNFGINWVVFILGGGGSKSLTLARKQDNRINVSIFQDGDFMINSTKICRNCHATTISWKSYRKFHSLFWQSCEPYNGEVHNVIE